jgi:FKBP-type peptidyl-prolyl cis-trans isomerase
MKKLLLGGMLLVASVLSAQPTTAFDTKHGYQMVLHTQKGGAKPAFEDEIVADVNVFVGDSLMQASRSFAPDGLQTNLPSQEDFNSMPSLPALVDAAFLMGVGDSATVYLKIDSFLRQQLPPALRSAKVVRYEIKLLRVLSVGAEKRKKRIEGEIAFSAVVENTNAMLEQYRAGSLKGVQKLPSGLKYWIKETGSGTPVQSGERVALHYYGCLKDGTMFDNSFQRGELLEFEAGGGQMIAGFDQGVLALRHGAKAYLFIPANLGYGETGSGPIPPNSEIIFYLEIQ